jgi:hypothetical protein
LVRRRLPVWAVVRRSYSYVWEHRTLFGAPLLLVFLIQLVERLYIQQAVFAAASTRTALFEQSSPASLVALAFSMSVVVGIHRTVLLDDVRSGFGFLRWDRNLLSYFVTSLILGFALISAGVLLAVVLLRLFGALAIYPVVAVVVLVIAALTLRLMLALPAAALGDDDRLRFSWKATEGNWLRLAAAAFLTLLPLMIVQVVTVFILVSLAQAAMHTTPPLLKEPIAVVAVSAAIRAVSLVVLTVMVSLSYDVLVRGGGPPETHEFSPS